jgi:hypothetical protein
MKVLVAILFTVLLPGICFGGEVEKLYYLGEFKLSDPSGKPYVSQVVLLEKTLDPDHSVWVERAIVVKPDGTAEEFTMNHRVTGDRFTLEDPKGMVKGSGTVFGPPWKGPTSKDHSRLRMACASRTRISWPTRVWWWRGKNSPAPTER